MSELENIKGLIEKIATEIYEYIEGYKYRGDNGDYTPNCDETALIIDCVIGIHEEIVLKAIDQAVQITKNEIVDALEHLRVIKKLHPPAKLQYDRGLTDAIISIQGE
jgi:hypothetical protein